MLGNLLRDALATAGHTGVDELPHVAAVLVRTRRTLRLPADCRTAPSMPVGLVHGRVHALVTAQHDPTQPDRMPAPTRPANLLQPALPLGITRLRNQAAHGRRIQLADDLLGHRRTSPRGHRTDTSAREHADTPDSGQSSRNAHRPGQAVTLMTPLIRRFSLWCLS
jgi:hypothetical protein